MKGYRDHRFPCGLKTVLHSKAGRSTTEVINISQGGARLVHEGALQPGDRVALDLLPGRPPLEAQVRWNRAAMLGLRFERVLSPGDVTRLRGTVSGSRAGGPVQLHVGLRELR